MKHGHNLILYFTKDDFNRLMELRAGDGHHLIKPGVTVEDSWLELTDSVARLHVTYRGINAKTGRPNQRRTRDVISFPTGPAGVAWLYQIVPDPAEMMVVREFWPGGHREAKATES